MSEVRFDHGTICTAIIQKYLTNSEIVVMKDKDDNELVIECVKANAQVVNEHLILYRFKYVFLKE